MQTVALRLNKTCMREPGSLGNVCDAGKAYLISSACEQGVSVRRIHDLLSMLHCHMILENGDVWNFNEYEVAV